MFELIDFLIVQPIINILFVIYNFVGDFGLAIIILTVLVKILMWPIVKRQLHQTKLIRKIQPELAEIKKNCKGNRQLESLQMMDLYRRHNIKPFRSVLTLLIQLPIFFALFTSVRVMVTPVPDNNVENRAYGFVRSMERIDHLVHLQKSFLADPSTTYDFKPQLFNTVDLGARAGFASTSEIIIFLFAFGAALAQYFLAKQQMPSGKSIKKRSFREILRESKDGKEPDPTDLNSIITSQTAIMMPIMILLIAINLPGALVFYYLLTNFTTLIQQKIVLSKTSDDMEITADKAVLKELRQIKEAEIIENKKTGTKITRLSAKDLKGGDKRRKP